MIRMATWNVQLGNRLPLILDGLTALLPIDVIALQELSERGGLRDAEHIATRLGPTWQSGQLTAQLVGGRHQANGFVWNTHRLDVQHLSAIHLPTPSGRVLRRLPPSRRNAALMEARVDQRLIRLYSVHLDVFGVTHKHAQFAHVLDDARRRPPVDLTLLVGDMNTYGIAGRPRWGELRRLGHAAGFEELTVGIGWTHRGLGVRQKLDAIFASPMGLAHQAQRIILPGSDHIPLVVRI